MLVLPDLIKRLARIRPRLIADVGSGTGYMSRRAAMLHTRSDVEWILLENDPEMLEMAVDLSRQDERIVPVSYDLLGTDDSWSGRFDFAFSCFSSLDFGMDSGVAARLTTLLQPGGIFVFYLPDLLEDVAQVCVDQGSMHPMHEYRRGAVSIGKPDRFTKETEPFVAHRLERCISDMLSVGTILSDLRFLERGGDRRLVTMEFKRLA